MYVNTTVEIGNLDLDVTNPRTTSEADQTAAIRSLIEVERDGEKIYALAQSICQMGTLDPGDRLYAIRSVDDPERYIVLDGNRRLTALRLLSQPGLVDRDDIGLSVGLRQRFKRLQKDCAGRWPSEVDTIIFETREAAAPFIRLRHTGENAGAGRSAWSALQVARFDDAGIWQCLKQLRDESALDLQVVNQLLQSAFPITNFERVASTSEFQTRFGYALGSTTFTFVADRPRAIKALSRLATDVATGRVDSRGEFAEARTMKPYFDELDAAISETIRPTSAPIAEPPPSRAPSAAPRAAPSAGTVQQQSSATGVSPEQPPSTPSLPAAPRKARETKYLIDKRDLSTVTSIKCREMVNELKGTVPVGAAPYACALLLRSLQEMTAEIYLEAFQLPTRDRTANIAAAASHLLGNSHPTDPANRRDLAINFKTSSRTYEELCEIAHSTMNAVSADHVRTTWRNLSGGLDLLWKRIHAQSLIGPLN